MRINRWHLFMTGLTGTTGAVMLAAGTYGLFSSYTTTASDDFTVGTVKIQMWNGDDCTPPTAPCTSTALSVDNLYPNKPEASQTFTVENTGTLDEWIGIMSHLPSDVPLQVSYTIDVYPPGPADSAPEPDGNGDLHSNCHTGSKGQGAGGEDKPLHHFESGTLSPADTEPKVPFELPVGWHAHVTYSYHLLGGAKESTTGSLKFDVWAVQYENNINPAKTGPISWAPQPADTSADHLGS